MTASQARCVVHQAEAAGACPRCGTFFCPKCSVGENGVRICVPCWEKGAPKRAADAVSREFFPTSFGMALVAIALKIAGAVGPMVLLFRFGSTLAPVLCLVGIGFAMVGQVKLRSIQSRAMGACAFNAGVLLSLLWLGR